MASDCIAGASADLPWSRLEVNRPYGRRGGVPLAPWPAVVLAPRIPREWNLMKLESLQDVFVSQLEDLYSAETQLSEALPKLAAAATDEQLREAFQQHSRETAEHVSRLKEIFSEVGIANEPNHRCEAMAGLLAEGQEIVK